MGELSQLFPPLVFFFFPSLPAPFANSHIEIRSDFGRLKFGPFRTSVEQGKVCVAFFPPLSNIFQKFYPYHVFIAIAAVYERACQSLDEDLRMKREERRHALIVASSGRSGDDDDESGQDSAQDDDQEDDDDADGNGTGDKRAGEEDGSEEEEYARDADEEPKKMMVVTVSVLLHILTNLPYSLALSLPHSLTHIHSRD